MYLFAGNSTSYALHSVTLAGLSAFTLALRVRTTSIVPGTVVMGSTDVGYLYVALQGGLVTDQVSLVMGSQSGGREKHVYVSAPTLFNGQTHSLIFTRTSTTVRAWLDGIELALSVGTNTLLAADVVGGNPLAVGGKWDGAALLDPCACAVGEIAIWNSVLNDDHIAWLSAAMSAASITPAPLHYWRALGDGNQTIGAATWTLNNATAADHPFMHAPAASVDHGSPSGPRYELYLKEGSHAVPGSDTPSVVLPRTITAPTLYGGSFPVSGQLFASVYAANETGRSTSGTQFTIPTNDTGTPGLFPTPPRRVQAKAIAGGYVEVRWAYVEDSSTPAAVAQQFSIAPVYMGPTTPGEELATWLPTIVTHVQPRQDYVQTIGPLVDGLFLVAVRSLNAAGLAAGVAAWVRVDSTAPDLPAIALSIAT